VYDKNIEVKTWWWRSI